MNSIAHIRTHHLFPYFVLILGLLSIAMSAIFTRWANAPGPVAGFYRMAIAAAVMAIPFWLDARKHAPLSSKHVWLAILAGILFAGDVAVWNTALLITNAANATFLGNTSTVWVGLGAMILFKEKLRATFWVGLFVALAGVLLIVGQDFISHPSLGAGDLLSLVAGFFYGSFFLAAERARDKLNSLSSWWIAAASSALVCLIAAFALRQPLTGYPIATYSNLLALALITQVSGWLAINYSLGHLPSTIAAPTLLGQPVLTVILAVPLLGQVLDAIQLFGCAVVLGGIWLVYQRKRAE